MARYFHISTGLRGAYLSDSACVIRCETRRELRDYLAQEARYFRESGYTGANNRAVAWLAAAAWREAGKARPAYLPHCLPLAPPHNRGSYSSGIFAGVATRDEFREFERESGE